MEKNIKRSDYDGHILYKRVCDYCETVFWSKKINGTCCSNACRYLKRNHLKKVTALKNI
jgi:hypothetical protein